jgi:hypothetical protein
LRETSSSRQPSALSAPLREPLFFASSRALNPIRPIFVRYE